LSDPRGSEPYWVNVGLGPNMLVAARGEENGVRRRTPEQKAHPAPSVRSKGQAAASPEGRPK